MRPAHKTISAGRLDIREQAVFNFRSRSFKEHPNLVLRPLPFRRSTYRFAASFYSQIRERV